MSIEYTNRGVCSRKTIVDLNDDNTIKDIQIIGGCSGNLQGLMNLLRGMRAEDAIKRLEGIDCNGKGTSCPDQISKALKVAIGQ